MTLHIPGPMVDWSGVSVPLTPKQAERTKRNKEIIALRRSGLSAKEIAAKTGITVGHIQVICRGHVMPHSSQKVAPEKVIEAVRCGPNLRAAARAVGLTLERVRQIVLRHETETGERFERHKRDYERHPLSPLVTLFCIGGCGKSKSVLPSAGRTEWRCKTCVGVVVAKVSPEVLEAMIRRKLNGETWLRLATECGYTATGSGGLIRLVFQRLQAAGRTEEIGQLWPKGISPWLRQFEKKEQ